ncbi:EAL domain-containing protein [Devosia sp.]|uniref:EAL domain-containing protein n=1 Tax=Devosia sp. TaxID=1871048 RepID=UPI0032659B58
MQRPQDVSDAIATLPSGLHVGKYSDLSLNSAFQPIYGLAADGLQLVAYEGLIRPRRAGQPVSPGELFANIDAPDRLFVESMCRVLHLRNFLQAVPIAEFLFINIDPSTYASIDVVEREFALMFSMLHKYGLSPQMLVCEVIETEALSETAMQRLWDMLRSHGAQLAIDDFGAGRSGIDRYRSMQPDVVKVDGDLFRDMATDPRRIKMLRTMLRTFREDSATVLVEGIETAEQLDIAHHVGATLFQGYYLGKPQILPAGFALNLPLAQASFDAPRVKSL